MKLFTIWNGIGMTITFWFTSSDSPEMRIEIVEFEVEDQSAFEKWLDIIMPDWPGEVIDSTIDEAWTKWNAGDESCR